MNGISMFTYWKDSQNLGLVFMRLQRSWHHGSKVKVWGIFKILFWLPLQSSME